MEQSDLIVIGAGPGGYLAAERAAQGGLAVTLFEGEHIGGTCLNVGCIPSKALLHSAKTYLHVAADGEACGIIADHIRVDHKKVLARKDRVVKTLVSGVEMQLKRQKVRVVRQQAYILGKREGGFAVRAGETEYLAARMIIAAGSVPLTPPIEGLQESIASGFALTNETIFDEKSVPRRLVVLGGGVIGMEMASYFRTAGSEVIVVEMLKNLGGNIGAQMSALLQQELEKRGFEIHLGCRASKVGKGEVEYLDETGTVHSIKADRVLVSLGRRARLGGYGLENLRVETTRQGIAVNERMETSVPGIYAVGDVNGRVPLAHTAYREAEVAVNNILGKKDAMDYGVIPSVLYTDPEISCVGETPESAEKKGYAVKTVTLPMQYSGRYVAEVDNGKGVCTVVYDTKRDRLLGVQVCATGSSEFIYGAEAFIGMKIPLERLKKLIFPHPTTGEIIREALFEL